MVKKKKKDSMLIASYIINGFFDVQWANYSNIFFISIFLLEGSTGNGVEHVIRKSHDHVIVKMAGI